MDVKKIGVFATAGTVNSGAYKKEITKYEYDKKHYRYVGKENATKIYNQNLCLEQFLKED